MLRPFAACYICNVSVVVMFLFFFFQAVMEIYNMYRPQLSAKNTLVLFDALHGVALHAHSVNSNSILRSRLQELGPMTQMQDPPLLRLENESYQICLTFLQNLVTDESKEAGEEEEEEIESLLVKTCQEVLNFYIETSSSAKKQQSESSRGSGYRWRIPLGSGKRRELAARAPLIVATLQAMCTLEEASFEKNMKSLFPLLASLISCEHGSSEVQVALADMLGLSVGPVLLQWC